MVYQPFNKVPPEILGQILTLAWPEEDEDSRDPAPSRFRFPSIPSQVDRYFNRTALSTPILWTYLLVDMTTDLDHIQDRIQRISRLLRLDLYIDFAYVEYWQAKETIARTIFASPSRFRKVTLSYRDQCILAMAPPRANVWDHLHPLTTLQTPLKVVSLTIYADQEDTVPPIDLLPTFGSSLRSVHLYGCALTWSTATLPDSLETLFIHEQKAFVSGILQFLTGTFLRSLRSLSLGGIHINWGDASSPISAILSSLEEFELGPLSASNVVTLLKTVRAPNLHHLSLKRILPHYLHPSFRALWSALRFPNLRKLTLNRFCDDVLPLEGLLGNNALDSVQCLEIIGVPGNDYVMDTFLRPTALSFCLGLRRIVADERPLSYLATLARRCTSLQTLEARFGCVADVCGDLTLEDAVALINTLANIVPGLKIVANGKKIKTNESELSAILAEGQPSRWKTKDLYREGGI